MYYIFPGKHIHGHQCLCSAFTGQRTSHRHVTTVPVRYRIIAHVTVIGLRMSYNKLGKTTLGMSLRSVLSILPTCNLPQHMFTRFPPVILCPENSACMCV